MLTQVRRLSGLLARYRVDRRLPPSVRDLMSEVVRYRRQDLVDRRRAAMGSPLGRGGAEQARLGDRMLSTVGRIDQSISELALAAADELSSTLAAASVDHFITDRRADNVVFGLEVSDRRRALAALAGLGDGWVVQWSDRGRSGLVDVADVRTGPASRAREVNVFRPMAIGARATGPEAGVVLTYYELGTSGEFELIGTRGHARFDGRSAVTTEAVEDHSFPGRSAFPVAHALECLSAPVDVVYTWVDGADPSWMSDFRRTAADLDRELDDPALDPARYRSRDELRYSLRSLWMYAGWIRHIHLVTAGQRPDWLLDHPSITVVDHQEIIPGEALPTFNSHAIEASLHRIPALAEHFLYFNDDMFLGRPTRPELFFTPNGLPRVFQSAAPVPGYEDGDMLAVDTAARRGRELLMQRFGRVVRHKPLHSPYPLSRSVLEALEQDFPDEVAATRGSRFRSSSDLSVAASVGQHFALGLGEAVFGELESEYVHVESARLRWHLDRIRLGRRFDTFCVNETRSGSDDDERELVLREFFEALFPVPAPWERV